MKNFLNRKLTKFPVLFLISTIAVSCTKGEELFKPYEEALGPGWICHVTPDEFKRAGIVVEQTQDGRYFFYREINDSYDRVTGGFDFPSLSLRSDFSFAGLSAFLTALGLDVGKLPIDASVEASYRARTTYGGASKTALTGEAAADAIADLTSELNSSSSRFYLIREAVAARSADVQISRSRSVRLGTSQNSSAQTSGSETTNVTKDFDRPLGICTISQEIARIQVAEDNENSRLPATAVIERKP